MAEVVSSPVGGPFGRAPGGNWIIWRTASAVLFVPMGSDIVWQFVLYPGLPLYVIAPVYSLVVCPPQFVLATVSAVVTVLLNVSALAEPTKMLLLAWVRPFTVSGAAQVNSSSPL